MTNAYLVVDEFCSRVDEVRASAFVAGFGVWTPGKGGLSEAYLDGVGFGGSHSLLLQSLLLATGLVPLPNLMHFRLTTRETEKAAVHSDQHMGNHTAIVYLSSHEKKHGTAFWRHRSTGEISLPSPDQQELYQEIMADIKSGDEGKWEMLDFVAGTYNRALIFRAPFFHCRYPLADFGEEGDKGRLIWACHYNYPQEIA